MKRAGGRERHEEASFTETETLEVNDRTVETLNETDPSVFHVGALTKDDFIFTNPPATSLSRSS